MKVLVTGAAGFIGSQLSERLLRDGHEVRGIDSITEYYDSALKERNLSSLLTDQRFNLLRGDLTSLDLAPVVADCDIIYHLAGQPGVRGSWGDDFRVYLERNIWATQRLLEAARSRPIKKFVFASSSSVYGDAERYPTSEKDLPRPVSPYGVSKLAAERLVLAYWRSYDIPVMAMRYFTVYGPRQRPDMAFSRFIASVDQELPIRVFGDGRQTRDFTFVSDAVDATAEAGYCPAAGEVLNIGGGSRVALIDVIRRLGEIMGKEPRMEFSGTQRGDVRDTAADVTRAREVVGYTPKVPLDEGLRRQVEFARESGDSA